MSEELVHSLSALSKHITSCGKLFIVHGVYQQFPGGRAGMELILQAIGWGIDIPCSQALAMVSAHRIQ